MKNIGTMTIGTMALSTILSAILTFVVCLVVLKLVLKVLDKLLERATRLDGTLKGFIRSAVKIEETKPRYLNTNRTPRSRTSAAARRSLL